MNTKYERVAHRVVEVQPSLTNFIAPSVAFMVDCGVVRVSFETIGGDSVDSMVVFGGHVYPIAATCLLQMEVISAPLDAEGNQIQPKFFALV